MYKQLYVKFSQFTEYNNEQLLVLFAVKANVNVFMQLWDWQHSF